MKTNINIETKQPSKGIMAEEGNYYIHEDGDLFLLVKLPLNYVLINVETGGHWTDPCDNIKNVFGCSYSRFRQAHAVTIKAQ